MIMSKRLIPGRVTLLENIQERFQILLKAGISNMGELLKSLKSKDSIQTFASISGIPAAWLLLVKREAGSYLSRPFPLSNFPGIPFEYIEVLRSKKITNTRLFFEQAQSTSQQNEIANKTGIPAVRLKEIFALCDLSRITGIGGIFARIAYEAGIKSTKEFARTDAVIHTKKYMAVIDKHGYAIGQLTEEDIQYCIDYARLIQEYSDKTDLL